MRAAASYAGQLSTAEWSAASSLRELPSKPFTKQFLMRMVELRPAPTFARHAHIVSFVFDQTYAIKARGSGAGSKYTNPVGRVDEKGDKIAKQRVVYINSFDLAVDARECRLSEAAINTIAERGPYTQDFARILPILEPQACERFMGALLKATADRLRLAEKGQQRQQQQYE